MNSKLLHKFERFMSEFLDDMVSSNMRLQFKLTVINILSNFGTIFEKLFSPRRGNFASPQPNDDCGSNPEKFSPPVLSYFSFHLFISIIFGIEKIDFRDQSLT